MIKVNVANYIINDLSKRFPMQNETVVDSEIIDVVLKNWSNKRYVAPNASVKPRHVPPQHNLYLM